MWRPRPTIRPPQKEGRVFQPAPRTYFVMYETRYGFVQPVRSLPGYSSPWNALMKLNTSSMLTILFG